MFRTDGYYNRFTDKSGNKVDAEVAEFREYITATVSVYGTAFFSWHYQVRDERGFWISRKDCPDQHFAMKSEAEATAKVREIVERDTARWTHSSEVKQPTTAW